MGQYTPMPQTKNIRSLNRRISKREYDMVIEKLSESGIKNGFIQTLDSASPEYTPDFDLSGL
jgi:putative pyruvate formate lyase activating enzyme